MTCFLQALLYSWWRGAAPESDDFGARCTVRMRDSSKHKPGLVEGYAQELCESDGRWGRRRGIEEEERGEELNDARGADVVV